MNKFYLLCAIGFMLLNSCRHPATSGSDGSSADSIYFSTASQSDNRLKKLGMFTPSENAGILDTNKLNIPKGDPITNDDNYRADKETDWILTLKTNTGEVFKKGDLEQLNEQPWFKNFKEATIYGHSPQDGKWHYVIAKKVPETFDYLEIGINLIHIYNTDTLDFNPARLEVFVSELKKQLLNYPAKVSLEMPEGIDRAVQNAKMLVKQNREFGVEAIVILKSETVFNGMKAWDALLSTGLRWGDGDLFHWDNPNRNYGDEQLFSVWTNTDPGYFLPEVVKSDKMNPKDLVFGFSIPLNADPVNVLDRMYMAAKYCQKRLGGTLQTASGLPFDIETEKYKVNIILSKMQDKGLQPGSAAALKICGN